MSKKAAMEKHPHQIKESVRATRPGSYMYKMQSFSLIAEFVRLSVNVKCFESSEFESNGHKWKLSVYPNGNKKDGVEDHISMYLVSANADIDSVETRINVIFKMFVYDRVHDNFLTIQDNEVRGFHNLKKEWGFARLISLKRFKDANNGYLMNDCCVFGVEIFVIPSTVGSGNLSMIKKPIDGTFSWKLDKFSTLKSVQTKEFQVDGHKLKLEIHPNGDQSSATAGKYLSMYVSLICEAKSYMSCVMKVRDQVNCWHVKRTLVHCFDPTSTCWGFAKFVSLGHLKNKYSGLILNDSLIAEVEVKYILNYDS